MPAVTNRALEHTHTHTHTEREREREREREKGAVSTMVVIAYNSTSAHSVIQSNVHTARRNYVCHS